MDTKSGSALRRFEQDHEKLDAIVSKRTRKQGIVVTSWLAVYHGEVVEESDRDALFARLKKEGKPTAWTAIAQIEPATAVRAR